MHSSPQDITSIPQDIARGDRRVLLLPVTASTLKPSDTPMVNRRRCLVPHKQVDWAVVLQPFTVSHLQEAPAGVLHLMLVRQA
jgi:hypothetical protein